MIEFLNDYNVFFEMIMNNISRMMIFLTTSIVGKILIFTTLMILLINIAVIIVKGCIE